METYFEYSAGDGGLLCWDETMDTGSDKMFKDMTWIHKEWLESVGARYIPQKHEAKIHTDPYRNLPDVDHRPCAIRLARNIFFEGAPPQHHRFDDPRIPK